MPSASDHDQQAADNEAFYRQELGGAKAARSEWAMTALFYCAVHEVQAFLVRKRQYLHSVGVARLPRRHQDRLTVLHDHFPTLEPLYRSLKDWSEDARYECATFTEPQLRLAEATLNNLRAEIAQL